MQLVHSMGYKTDVYMMETNIIICFFFIYFRVNIFSPII